jgi:hypothetical protein
MQGQCAVYEQLCADMSYELQSGTVPGFAAATGRIKAPARQKLFWCFG